MSSLFDRINNRYLITTTVSHLCVAASLITALYLLTEGWVW
jgi:hypothetical protein